RRQEHAKVRARYQFGKHAGGLVEEVSAQRGLGGAEALGNSWQMPYRVDRDLDHRNTAVGVDGMAIGLQAAGSQCVADFDQVEPRTRDGDAWADVEAFGDLRLEHIADQMTPR